MICRGRYGRRHRAGRRLLLDTAHHIIHCSCNVLTDSTANGHACHHCRHIEAFAAISQIYITSTIGSHLAKCLCARNADFRLFLYLESADVCRLCLFVQGVLTFFSLNTQTLYIILCFRFNFCRGYILCNRYQLTITFAGFVDFNGADIYTGDNYAKGFFQPFPDIILYHIVDLCCFGFDLNHRDVVGGGCIGNRIFHVSTYGIPDLFLKIVKIECVEPIQFDKLPVIPDLETDCASDGDRNTKISKSRIVHIKERYAKLYLNDSGEVYEVNFRLKGGATIVGKPHNPCQNREVFCLDNLIEGADNEILHYAVFLLVDKDRNFSVFYT